MYVESARVGPRLCQRARAVDGLLQEVGQLGLQPVPRQAFLQSPSGRVLPEGVVQVPGKRVVLGPQGPHVPESWNHANHQSFTSRLLHSGGASENS